MKITPLPNDLDLLKSDLVRSPGLHMSDIYSDLYMDLEPTRFVRGAPKDPVRMSMGFNLEVMLEEGLRRRMATRPEELLTREGIAFSPDLLIHNHVMRVGEIKLTWMSSREVPREPANGFPPKFDKYFTQVKSYAYHLETNYARLYILFVNGDYTHPFKPEILCWDVEFTDRELKENWDLLLSHAKRKGML